MHKKIMILMLVAISINFTGCSSMRGNVIPEKGPTMEQIYDGTDGPLNNDAEDVNYERNLMMFRKQHQTNVDPSTISSLPTVPINTVGQEFRKLPNPELRMYVFPHLAGKDQLPVPGYFTVFNVYEHNHYALAKQE